ncbi:hypothetical protein C1H46_045748 [Malus baccata]|uniref:Uncharacterized protein n=1 Tax=Malus baccata TaxID=106549 RepID=A0A540K373_MALBA|nr:hypothetical protein C1H46_045748 [Malus baccata]
MAHTRPLLTFQLKNSMKDLKIEIKMGMHNEKKSVRISPLKICIVRSCFSHDLGALEYGVL